MTDWGKGPTIGTTLIAGAVASLVTAPRSLVPRGRWIGCSLAVPLEVRRPAREFSDGHLDALQAPRVCGSAAPSLDACRFEASPLEVPARVLAVDLLAPILLGRALRSNLRRAADPRAVLIGSLSGLDGRAGPEVANSASRFGLRGAAQAMAAALRTDGIADALVNRGNVTTTEVLDDVAAGRFGAEVPILMSDLAAAIDCALAMSPASTIAGIKVAQRRSGA